MEFGMNSISLHEFMQHFASLGSKKPANSRPRNPNTVPNSLKNEGAFLVHKCLDDSNPVPPVASPALSPPTQNSSYYRSVYPDLLQFAPLSVYAGVSSPPPSPYFFIYPHQPYYFPVQVQTGSFMPAYTEASGTPKTSEKSDKKSDTGYERHTTSYMKRNVYKSIIRAMFRYLKNNERKVVEELKGKNFSEEDIRKAFKAISELNREEAVLKNPRKSQTALSELISENAGCTYILKEALRHILDNWTKGRMGRISSTNIHTYRQVYQDFHAQALKLLSP